MHIEVLPWPAAASPASAAWTANGTATVPLNITPARNWTGLISVFSSSGKTVELYRKSAVRPATLPRGCFLMDNQCILNDDNANKLARYLPFLAWFPLKHKTL